MEAPLSHHYCALIEKSTTEIELGKATGTVRYLNLIYFLQQNFFKKGFANYYFLFGLFVLCTPKRFHNNIFSLIL